MKKYESVVILDIRKVEDEGNSFAEEFGKMVSDWGGKVDESVSMGRKQFAREIGTRKAGVYWNFIFSLDAAKIADIHDRYKLDERVIRLMIINYDRPEKKVVEPTL